MIHTAEQPCSLCYQHAELAGKSPFTKLVQSNDLGGSGVLILRKKKNALQHKDSSKASVYGLKEINSSASFNSKETPETSLPWPWLHTGRKWKARLRQSFWFVSKGIDRQGCPPWGWMQGKIHLPSVASETDPHVSERVPHLKRHVGSLPPCSPGGRREGKFDTPILRPLLDWKLILSSTVSCCRDLSTGSSCHALYLLNEERGKNPKNTSSKRHLENRQYWIFNFCSLKTTLSRT